MVSTSPSQFSVSLDIEFLLYSWKQTNKFPRNQQTNKHPSKHDYIFVDSLLYFIKSLLNNVWINFWLLWGRKSLKHWQIHHYRRIHLSAVCGCHGKSVWLNSLLRIGGTFNSKKVCTILVWFELHIFLKRCETVCNRLEVAYVFTHLMGLCSAIRLTELDLPAQRWRVLNTTPFLFE